MNKMYSQGMPNQLAARLVRLNLVYHTRIKNSVTPKLILSQCYVCMRIVLIEIDHWNPIIIQSSKSHLKCKKNTYHGDVPHL